ncbi:MAG TPA: redoxin domain-containing protein [Burkholderiaceae bacterium]|nr:redoxin domain-containing protein [Burkholderiaceae bacterium]
MNGRPTRPRLPGRRAAVVAAALAAALAAVAPPALADASPGRPAPSFTLRDVAGRDVSLADFRGRTVVLEWTNPGCPFVRKHYVSGNLPGLQRRWTGRDVVWLAVSSTHPGHADWLEPPALAAALKDWGAAPTAVLTDPEGTAGRAYGARTTPQLWVIDPQGVVRFAGGIDDRRSASVDDVKLARNHVAAALDELQAGRPVSVATAPPYGCSVKYR